ncbi:MAG: hypothetical protein FJ291_33220 [Planctomycetes bacterium]|nr:hypothetical protein [Planctomycetota bacterium]
MEPVKKPRGQAPRRVERPAPEVSAGGKLAIGLTIAGVAGLLALVGLLVARSSSRARAPAPPAVPDTPKQEPPKPEVPPTPEQQKEDEEWLKQYLPPDSPKAAPRGLRQRIDAEYQATKRRVKDYVAQERWGDAIGAYERLLDRYDDEELRLRADPELMDLRHQAKRALKTKLAEADKLADAGRYAEARKALEAIVATLGREDLTAQAKERLQQIIEREDAEAAAEYAAAIAAVDAKLPGWHFEDALADAQKLSFARAQYKALHARRLERIRELAALKKKMIHRIGLSTPRLNKRTIGVPGWPGELTMADAQVIYTMTDHGQEKIAWERLGPEAAARLALLAGKADDPNHRLAVARLLMEVGHHARAKQELESAKAAGADTSADEADLASRQPPAPQKK